MDLTEKHCVPCEGGTPSMNETEVQKYIKQVKGWEVIGSNIPFLLYPDLIGISLEGFIPLAF